MTYLKPLIAAVSFSLMASVFALPSHAQDVPAATPTTVVELFTSQGCSSCPPANQFVGDLSDDPDMLVLSYGVTYWDYLGWKDSFGDVRFTERQKAYGKAFDIGNVYTPQIVLNGSAHSPRYQEGDIRTMPLRAKGEISLTARDGLLFVDGAGALTVLVSYTPGWQSVDVSKGENSGRTLKLANVVKDLRAIDRDGLVDVTLRKDTAYAAIVHDPQSKKIIDVAVYNPVIKAP